MSFSKLPPESVLDIADNLDEKNILSLLRCSQQLRDILIPYLYLRNKASGGSALSWCAEHGFEQGVKRMLQLKVDPDTPRKQLVPSFWRACSAPLYLAAKKGHESIVKLLVKEKVDLNFPLLISASKGGYDPSPLTEDRLLPRTYEKIVEVLLEHGANPNFLGHKNVTPLTLAILSPNLNMVKLLLSHGARVDYPGDSTQDQSSWVHPIHAWLKSCHQGSPDSFDLTITGRLLELLLRYGADISWRNGMGRSPIHVAAEEDITGLVVRQLIRHGADVDCKRRDGSAALHGCTVAAAVALIENGANIHVRDSTGGTPLHSTTFRLDIQRILLDAGANPNCKDHEGESVLVRAAGSGYPDVVRLLLERGAEVNSTTNRKETPLHRAVRFARKRNVKLLLDHGANVNAQRDTRQTPLDDVSRRGYVRADEVRLAIRLMLLEHGAISSMELLNPDAQ